MEINVQGVSVISCTEHNTLNHTPLSALSRTHHALLNRTRSSMTNDSLHSTVLPGCMRNHTPSCPPSQRGKSTASSCVQVTMKEKVAL